VKAIIQLIAVIGTLFIAFLWSGGVYEHKKIGDQQVRINKITDTVEYLRFDAATNSYTWHDITKTIPKEDLYREELVPIEDAAPPSSE